MLWTITIILFILWIVGLVSSYTLGGWIHILLVLAIIKSTVVNSAGPASAPHPRGAEAFRKEDRS
jgi:uncharacterized protein (DUF58 family)